MSRKMSHKTDFTTCNEDYSPLVHDHDSVIPEAIKHCTKEEKSLIYGASCISSQPGRF